MSLTTIPVTCIATDDGGAPVAGAVFVFALNITEVDGQLVAPEPVTVVGDVNGTCVVQLWPNVLGALGSVYVVTITNPVTGRYVFRGYAWFPGQVGSETIYLHEHLVDSVDGGYAPTLPALITAHNVSTTAHQDIRDLATALTIVVNANVTATQTNTQSIEAAQIVITQNTTNITAVSSTVATKADTTVVTALADVVATNTTNITNNTTNITSVTNTVATKADASAVTSLTVVVDNSVTQVAANTANISQNTTDISGKAGLAVANVFTKSQASGMVSLGTVTGTVTLDASAGNTQRMVLGGNITLAAPSNPMSAQNLGLHIIQDTTGARTITWNAAFKWAGGIAPTLSSSASARDFIAMTYDDVSLVWVCSMSVKGAA